MKLVHFSHKLLGEIVPREQEPNPAYGRFVRKPAGLWVSDEAHFGWKEWCEQAEFSLGEYPYRVHLKAGHNVLLVGEGDMELEEFHAEFSRQTESEELGDLVVSLRGLSDRWIDWNAVAERWQGVIISPYRFDLRLARDFMWYYGWDCASGCIWNPDAIEKIEFIP